MVCPVCGEEFTDEFCPKCGFGKSQNRSVAEWYNSPYRGETKEQAAQRLANMPKHDIPINRVRTNVNDEMEHETIEDLLETNNDLLYSIKNMLTFFTVLTIIGLVCGLIKILSLLFVFPKLLGL